VRGDQRGDGAIEKSFGRFFAGLIQHGIGVHVVADIAHQHQAAAGQNQIAAAGRVVNMVGLEAALHSWPPLSNGGERAVHQAQPVAVEHDLVGGVHRGDAVLAIHDGADSGFQDHVGDAGMVVAPIGCARSISARCAGRFV
jgi:hypothetical protein